MGQMTVGILYGVRWPEGLVLYSDEEGEKGLLDRWYDANREAIDARYEWIKARCMAKPGTMPYQFEGGSARIIPDAEYDNDPPLMGFWICAGASGKDGLPRMESLAMPTAKVRTVEPYAKAYRNARRRWGRFARWARAQGVEVGKPRLWRAETEVA